MPNESDDTQSPKQRHWNYRVFRESVWIPLLQEYQTIYSIREAYYDADAAPDSVPKSWTANAVTLYAENLEDLKGEIDRMQRALTMPVIDI